MSEYRISDNLAVSESGFLFMANSGESFTVNETGRFIINSLKENKSEEEILSSLTNEFDIDIETAQRDFDEFLTLLRNLKLVEEL